MKSIPDSDDVIGWEWSRYKSAMDMHGKRIIRADLDSNFGVYRERIEELRVLLTGGSGFVGNHIWHVLLQMGIEVVGVDRAAPPPALADAWFVRCDVRNTQHLTDTVATIQPDAIVHAAAITPAESEINRALEIVEVNQVSTMALLVSGREAGIKQFVFLSSAGVYDDPDPGQSLFEESPVSRDNGLYVQTKLASELLCAWAGRELGIRSVALRIGPVYGEWERPTSSRARMSPVLQAVDLALRFSEIRCNASRAIFNWIHGDDIGRAIYMILRDGISGSCYNLAGPPETLAATLNIVQILIPGTEIIWEERMESSILQVSGVSRPLSSAKLANDLKFLPEINLPEGIERLVNHRTADSDRHRGKGAS